MVKLFFNVVGFFKSLFFGERVIVDTALTIRVADELVVLANF